MNGQATMQDSSMTVDFISGGRNKLDKVVIKLSGRAARIPSLKNNKIPGTNFTAPDTMARVRELDALFMQATGYYLPAKTPGWCFGAEKVFCTLICGKRGNGFDVDNCFTTIKDWFEPWTKKVGKGKQRGWGVGIVENDRQVQGIALNGYAVDYHGEDSFIVVQRLESIKDAILTMISGLQVL